MKDFIKKFIVNIFDNCMKYYEKSLLFKIFYLIITLVIGVYIICLMDNHSRGVKAAVQSTVTFIMLFPHFHIKNKKNIEEEKLFEDGRDERS